MLWSSARMWPVALTRLQGKREGEEYNNYAVYNEALLATMGNYLWNDILL